MAGSPSAAPEERPKPLLARFFEAVAEVMELDHGAHRLELIFEDGHLRQYWAHAEKRRPSELGRYDAEAVSALLVDRVREVGSMGSEG